LSYENDSGFIDVDTNNPPPTILVLEPYDILIKCIRSKVETFGFMQLTPHPDSDYEILMTTESLNNGEMQSGSTNFHFSLKNYLLLKDHASAIFSYYSPETGIVDIVPIDTDWKVSMYFPISFTPMSISVKYTLTLTD
jgi:hypothetical protein